MNQRTLSQLLGPTIEALGLELWHLEYQQGRLLRVYIDRDGGPTLDDCEAVSHQLSALLDVEDVIPGPYRLEVSSPGLERRLHSADHYRRFVGSDLALRLCRPLRGRRHLQGRLQGVTGTRLALLAGVGAEPETIEIDMDDIERANIVMKAQMERQDSR